MTAGTNPSKWVDVSTGSYKVTFSSLDDAVSDALTLPFTFHYGSQTVRTIYVNTNGRAYFGTSSEPTANFSSAPFHDGILNQVCWMAAPYASDLKLYDNSRSYVRYKTTGTMPNRTYTVEWRAGRYSKGAAVDTISFQLQLDEGTNVIRFVYGKSYSSEYSSYQAGFATGEYDFATVDISPPTTLTITGLANTASSSSLLPRACPVAPP